MAINKQAELANPESCLNRARADEPIFVLRANDPVAARAIRMWAGMYIAEKETQGVLTEANRTKYHEAMQLADKMDAWRHARGQQNG